MNWNQVETAIQTLRPTLHPTELKTVGILCAAYKVGANPPAIAALTGYPQGLIHDALCELREKMFINGKSVAERDVLRVLPNGQALLKGLLVNEVPAIEVPTQPTQPITEEIQPMDSEDCKCGRPANHRGLCKGTKPVKKLASQSSDIAKPEAPKVTFSISCETFGQKYQATGTTLEAFNSAINIANQMMETKE